MLERFAWSDFELDAGEELQSADFAEVHTEPEAKGADVGRPSLEPLGSFLTGGDLLLHLV